MSHSTVLTKKQQLRSGHLPRRNRGRQSPEANARYWAEVEQFAEVIVQIASCLEFRPSARGWCYILEGKHYLTKGEFEAAFSLINDCRKRGILPLDICCEDDKRQFSCLEDISEDSPRDFAQAYVDGLLSVPRLYFPISFWEDQDYFLQMVTEKIDLRELFAPVCKRFRVPIVNAGGWSDINSRANMMQRFAQWEARGKTCVLLYCGDFDPGGVLMSESLFNGMAELRHAVNWDPSNVIIDRFGLNREFIEEHGLSWIDNLITGSNKDLANPQHGDHAKPYVQNWLRDVGVRKVEANALVVDPDAGRRLCEAAITKYVPPSAPEEYESRLELPQRKVRQAIRDLLREGNTDD
jgi:hypothetical protein